MRYSPSISIILSTWNGAEFLSKSIESVLEQTYKNFEFIIVDDGSTDRTPEILRDYAKRDPRIKIITNDENIGLTKSLNKAIRVAHGKYIARQDADDISLPQRLEKQIEYLLNHPEIKVLGTFGYLIAQEAKILGKEIVPVSSQAIKKTLIKRNPFIHSSVMIEKEIIDKIGRYNERFKTSQDYELWFRILRVARGQNLPLFLVKKRYRPTMISFSKNKEQLKYMLFLQREAIKRGGYSEFYYIYFLRTYLSLKCPLFFKIFLKRYFSKKRNVLKKI